MADPATQELFIDTDRLVASLKELGQIGAFHDERSGLQGVCRLALSQEDGEGRALVMRWFEEAGLSISVDKIGNVYAQRDGEDNSLAPVMMGSHIDSVPTAGIYDGCLGVLGGLEVIRTLNDAGITTRRPLVVAFFTEEEGCRFGTDMLGSAVAVGRIPLESAYANVDRDGITVKSELEKLGFIGDEEPATRKPHAYVECHIEQGPLLGAKGLELGVVTGVQAISWQEVSIVGKSAHAGTTPMEYRKDAGVAAAKINLKMREMATSGEFGAGFRTTMGAVRPHPDLVNIIPGRLVCTVDLRNPDDAMMVKAEAELTRYYEQIQEEEGVEISWRQTAKTPAIPFDPGVQAVITESANELGLSNEPILSGAGHDAQEFASICKTAMIFVPGENDGISHNPRELSTPKQCADGINTLLRTVRKLAAEDDA